MKTVLNEYQVFVAKLFQACEITEDNVVLVDTDKVSIILEAEFTKVGLLTEISEFEKFNLKTMQSLRNMTERRDDGH